MRFKKKIRLIKDFIHARYFGGKHPLLLDLMINSSCNFDCIYCNMKKFGEDMQKERVLEIIEKMHRHCAFLFLSGGEPLLHPDFEEIVRSIKKYDGLFLTIITNGSLICQKIETLKEVDHIEVSLDGPPEAQNVTRKKNSHDAIIEGIKLLREKGKKTSINVVLTKYNINKLDYLFDLAERYGISHITPLPPNNATLMDKKKLNDILPSKREMKEAMDNIINSKNRYKCSLSNQTLHHIAMTYPSFRYKKNCKILNYVYAIDVRGKLQMCCTERTECSTYRKPKKQYCHTCANIINLESANLRNFIRGRELLLKSR